MFDIAESLTTLSRLMPPEQALTVPELPDFSAVVEVAAQFGAQATTIAEAKTLYADIEKAQQALPLMAQTFEYVRACLTNIAGDMLQEAATIAPQLLHLDPAVRNAAQIQLRALSEHYMEMAMVVLEEAEAKLATPTSIFQEISQHPVEALAGLSAGTPLPAPGTGRGEAAVAAAKSALGTPYVWGGTSLAGFDCSGFTQWAWRQAGVELPRLAQDQTVGIQVSRDQLQPGDLAVWDGHVAMYAGNGQLIEAGSPVQLTPLREHNLGMAFKGYYRPG